MNVRTLTALVLSAALLTSAAVHADEASPAGSRFDPASFAQHRANIVEELKVGDLYREISEENRELVLETLDRMGDVLDGVQSIDQLDQEQKVALFNDQELVNTLLTDARNDSRLICTREHTVGTRFKRVDCATVAKRRQRSLESQGVLRNMMAPKGTDFGRN